jgi:rhodanese-related sulfurtransferase
MRDSRLKVRNSNSRSAPQLYAVFRGLVQLCACVSLLVLSLEGHAAKREYCAPLTVPGAKTVSVDEARWLYDEAALFIDVRNSRLYARRHIPRAVHLDFKDRFTLEALEAVADRHQPIVIYSSGVRCARAYRAATLAVDWGFRDVHYFRGGIVDWRDVQFPLQSVP